MRATRRAVRTVVVAGGIVLATSFVALGLAEGLVRLVEPQQLILIRTDLWQPADTIGWRLRPNVVAQVNTGERTVTIRTDRDGFRVGSAGRREAPTRVLLIGDSFMEALQVEHEQSTAHLLESDVSRRLGVPVVVRNAGVSDWGPNQYVLRARQLLARDTFALVLVAVFVGNDAIDARIHSFPPREPARRHQFEVPRGVAWSEMVRAVLAPINDALEVRSHLFILLKRQLATLRMRMGMTAAYFPRDLLRSEAASPRWRITADAARDLAREAAGYRVPTLFVLIPERLQVSEKDLDHYVRGFGVDRANVDLLQPSRMLREAFATESLEVLDALPAFTAATREGLQLFGSVDQHLSPDGHRVLATFVAPEVARHVRP